MDSLLESQILNKNLFLDYVLVDKVDNFLIAILKYKERTSKNVRYSRIIKDL